MPTRKPVKLDKQVVAEAALTLLNEVGFDGLTLRAIARVLHVQAPALYWHFENKQALLDEMATVIYRRMAAAGAASAPDATWQARLLAASRRLRTTLLGYRDGARVFSGSRFTAIDHAAEMETALQSLLDAGFTLRQAVAAGSTLHLFTLGFVAEEQGVHPVPGERRDGYDVAARAAAMADFPLAAAAGAEIFEDYDARFEEGLRLVLAGIEATYGRGTPARTAPAKRSGAATPAPRRAARRARR